MTARFSIAAARIFDGERFHENAALVVEDGRVAGIAPATESATVDTPGLTLVPGFVDWQVNGGGGVLFNDDPTPEGVAALAAAHVRRGTTALLPTLITDAPEKTRAAAAAVDEAIRRAVPGVVGAHFEGPHIAAARKGAHDPALIRPMTPADRARLAAPREGVRVVTLAPEAATVEDVAALAAAGVVVSLGHSDADYATATRCFEAGARAVTHLFNAMGPLGHRAPGLVGAALDAPDVWCGLIADGVHVHPAVLRLAARAKPGRITLVSDAMPTVGCPGEIFTLNGREVRRESGRLVLADGTLAGADLDLAAAVRVMVREAGVDLAEALRMASLHPARLLGLGSRGHFQPGARADVAALDAALEVRRVWIGGAEIDTA